jgi:hypothetical protein
MHLGAKRRIYREGESNDALKKGQDAHSNQPHRVDALRMGAHNCCENLLASASAVIVAPDIAEPPLPRRGGRGAQVVGANQPVFRL